VSLGIGARELAHATKGLRFPEPAARPGQSVDFSRLRLASEPHAKPPIDVCPHDIRHLAFGLIRVLGDDGLAAGDWAPQLDARALRAGLRAMLLTRAYDDRMYRAQRQGKSSFFMKCRGEEAIGVAQASALNRDDMCFPTYRLHALLIARGYPIAKLMAQTYSNAHDALQGRQMPMLPASREYNYFSHSANLGNQFSQAVGWAMAAALHADPRIASAWIGDGATAEGDFHYALTFAAVYRAPVILNIVNNQWAISSFQGVAGGENTTFAARGVGYGLPALRVDGNDFLAVYAVTEWAHKRAVAGLGATVIEFVTYRVEAHSTSDDPSRYRANDEAAAWPLGDPVERLKQHLLAVGEWSDEQHVALQEEIAAEVRRVQREVESVGTLAVGEQPSPRSMFEDIYQTPDWRLKAQRQQMGY
jgi:2-oxoisovalerate dehydrogenase E1 component alpha subunit